VEYNSQKCNENQIRNTLAIFVLSQENGRFTREDLFKNLLNHCQKDECQKNEINKIINSSIKKFLNKGLIYDDIDSYIIKNPNLY